MEEDTDPKEWTSENELKLLDAISDCGFGNWRDISSKVPPFSPSECEQHYNIVFMDDFSNKLRRLGLCSSNCKIEIAPKEVLPVNCSSISDLNRYIRSLENNEISGCPLQDQYQSGRINVNKSSHLMQPPIPGYNRLRSDFDIEFENSAESILRMISEHNLNSVQMDKDEADLIEEVEFVLYQAYNQCLKERQFRRRIIRNHCLLDRRKVFSKLQRLEVSFGSTTLKSLIPLFRYMNGPQLDYLVERMRYQNELKLKKSLLIEYRNVGIKYLTEIEIYKKLNNKRQQNNAELRKLSSLCPDSKSITQYNRKPTAPLMCINLPGYNLLNDNEKQLCSTYRLVPETYLNFKEVLVAECEKHNGLRLAQARSLIKIDVNKTRKIYDYLISQNLIWAPES